MKADFQEVYRKVKLAMTAVAICPLCGTQQFYPHQSLFLYVSVANFQENL
jgi:hypothetical protein